MYMYNYQPHTAAPIVPFRLLLRPILHATWHLCESWHWQPAEKSRGPLRNSGWKRNYEGQAKGWDPRKCVTKKVTMPSSAKNATSSWSGTMFLYKLSCESRLRQIPKWSSIRYRNRRNQRAQRPRMLAPISLVPSLVKRVYTTTVVIKRSVGTEKRYPNWELSVCRHNTRAFKLR